MEKNENGSLVYEMAKQLHEQYAANDNAKTTNVIGFLTAITFIFVGFGYVYVQPYLSTALNEDADYPQLLLSADIIANLVLVLLSVLCVNFGYSTRRDHVVITRLRKLYMDEYLQNSWFNGKFDGFRKGKFSYLPDYYMIMFVFIQVFIITLSAGCLINEKKVDMCCCITIGVMAIIINVIYFLCKYKKYEKFQTCKKK